MINRHLFASLPRNREMKIITAETIQKISLIEHGISAQTGIVFHAKLEGWGILVRNATWYN